MTPSATPESWAKATAKAILPRNLVAFISGCRYRGYRAHVAYLLKLKRYRTLFAHANATAPDSTIVLPGDCRIAIPQDAQVRDAFEHFGWKDPEAVEEFRAFMKLDSNATVLWDIGALFGCFSLAFALKSADHRALAFEPNPESREKLEECLRLNPTAKVKVFDSAIGLAEKVVKFESGFHYTAVVESPVQAGGEGATEGPTVTIKTDSVDELIERGLEPPDIVKIDVEGHEFDVLRGARRLLLSKKPALSLELHPELLTRRGTSCLAIVEYLEAAGYVFFDSDLKRVTKSYFEHKSSVRVVAM